MQKRRRQPAFTAFAVLILLVQLVLTAGHFHAGERDGVYDGHTAAWPRLVHGSDPVSPLQSDDDCDLCWAQFIASSSLIPAPALLPVPPSAPALHPDATVHGPRPSTRTAYRSRAPPRIALE
jgi:hypothetical protein